MLPFESRDRKFFGENGYLKIERFVDERRCEILANAADHAADGHYANMLDLHDQSTEFRDLLLDKNVLNVLDTLQDARMIPIGSIFFFCKPGNPLEQGSIWHQDHYAVKAPFGSYLVASVALDDADESNGALEVVPGTHRLGDLPNSPSKNFEFDAQGNIVKAYPIGNEVKLPLGYSPVTLSYPKGTLLIIHGHLIHGARKNPSDSKWRRALYMHYIKDGDPFWPGWNANRHLISRPDKYVADKPV